MRFWLDMGVDGFRLDAVPYLIEREGTNCENLPETHEFLKRAARARRRELPGPGAARRGQPVAGGRRRVLRRRRRVPHGFHFPLMPRMFMAVRQEDRYPIVEILAQTPEIPENCQWASSCATTTS
jgi:maltose alpha-D-glucosyltransferase/alpha-amylase